MIRSLLALVAAASLAACASVPSLPKLPPNPGRTAGQKVSPPTATTAAAPELAPLAADATPREQLSRAVDLMSRGEAGEARAMLNAVLAKSPKDTTATHLLEQIDADPRVLLGEKSESYVVAPGDTMSGLAQRFLGDQLLFYALSRYNDLPAPNALAVGRALRIPSRPGVALPAPSGQTANESPAADPAKANVIRLRALEQLNKGNADLAVSLLTEAQALDVSSAAIRKDLDRARRIQAALTTG